MLRMTIGWVRYKKTGFHDTTTAIRIQELDVHRALNRDLFLPSGQTGKNLASGSCGRYVEREPVFPLSALSTLTLFRPKPGSVSY